MGTVLALWLGGTLAAWLMCISEETTTGPLPKPMELGLMFLLCLAWPVTLPFGIYIDIREQD